MKHLVAQAVLGACVVAGCSSAVRPLRTAGVNAQAMAEPACRAQSAVQPQSRRVRWIGPAEKDSGGIAHIARPLNMSLFYVPSMRNGVVSDRYAPSDRGNAILSTVPLADPMAIELPGEGQRRVAVTATMTVTDGNRSMPLSIGAAHLATRGPRRTLYVFGATG